MYNTVRHESESFEDQRRFMVDEHLIARGIDDPDVIKAFLSVPREAFVPSEMKEFAYHDTPLSIEKGQTISQPYIVALMTQALDLKSSDRVLEVGTGSGYSAAILSRIVKEVFTVERHSELADIAEARLKDLSYNNIHILTTDGTLGWSDYAPYDAIVVAAGGPEIPISLVSQLSFGGRLVIPVGKEERSQRLLKVTRIDANSYQTEDIGGVRFVPLIGQEGWANNGNSHPSHMSRIHSRSHDMSLLLRESVSPITSIEEQSLDELLERIGDARVVLIGEATHGTSEFYRMRAEITKKLIQKKGFKIVAIEGDWPDASLVNRYVKGQKPIEHKWKPFSRFPTWMWRNKEVVSFLEWLHVHNSNVKEKHNMTEFYGLDLYSLFCSIDFVLQYLDGIDKQAASVARERYGCLSPFQSDPAGYGKSVLMEQFAGCEKAVVSMLQEILKKQLDYRTEDTSEYFNAVQNSRLIANAEKYYRTMYYGGAASWNLRDRHMYETLLNLLTFKGEGSKAVIWAHNSHVGDARATEMSKRGEFNIGQLCRSEFGEKAFIIGFGTDNGVVAAASDWGGEMELKKIRPSHAESYEKLCHDSEIKAFFLHLKDSAQEELLHYLMEPRLSRAIGVIYRPETELQSHYYQTVLPKQFDEYIWFDSTTAIGSLSSVKTHGIPDTFPFGL